MGFFDNKKKKKGYSQQLSELSGVKYKKANDVTVLWETNSDKHREHGRWVFGLAPIKKRKRVR